MAETAHSGGVRNRCLKGAGGAHRSSVLHDFEGLALPCMWPTVEYAQCLCLVPETPVWLLAANVLLPGTRSCTWAHLPQLCESKHSRALQVCELLTVNTSISFSA
uniref:Uncharacterized protein n=1 Tax=Sphaerodactylus townsendi TaxID=933632 RepID=A0ACB8EEA4_9SAUR